MPRRTLAAAAVIAALLVAGCSSPKPAKTDPQPPASGPATTGNATAATATTATTATVTPTPGTVPFDQIPPGRPARWIPAGMPTVAPWKEPGDVLPTFTPAMFEHTPAGARDVATFFVLARNWALATLDPAAYLLVCDAPNCQQNAQRQRTLRALGQHVIGGRGLLGDVAQRPVSPETASDERIARLTISLQPEREVDSTGKVLQTQPAATRKLDLILRWKGKMWRITDVSLVIS